MPSIQVHGEGSGASSKIPGARFGKINNNLQAMQDAAAEAASKSSVPWASDKWKRANDAFAKQMEQSAARAAGPAKEAFESAIPWLNPRIRTINANLARQVEADAKRAAQVQTRQTADSAQLAKSAAAAKAKQEKAAFGASYKEASSMNARFNATDPNSYRAAQARALGISGSSGNWRQYGAAQRGLAGMQAQHGSHPVVAAAIRAAKMRISASGNGGGMVGRIASTQGGSTALSLAEGLGMDMGELELAGLAGPLGLLALGAYKVGKGIVKAPFTLRDKAMEAQAPALEYMALRSRYAGIGRASNLDSRQIESKFSSGDPAMEALGLGPTQGADVLTRYGVSPRSADQAAWTAQEIAKQQFNGSLGGLPGGLDRYASMAGFAKNAGFASNNGSDANALSLYFKTLERVTSVAVSQGMDRSQSVSNMENLLRSGARAGAAGMTADSVADMANKLSQAGTPGARLGNSANDIMGASVDLANKVGFNPSGGNLQNQMLASAVQNMGGLAAFSKNDDALKKMIGPAAYEQLTQTPGGRQRLADIRLAAKSGMGMSLNNALGNVLGGNPAAQRNIYSQSVYGKTLPMDTYLGIVARQKILGVSAAADADQRGAEREGARTSAGPLISTPSGPGGRGWKANNPLNLEYRGQAGALGTDGRFAVFGTMEGGVAAAEKQLLMYQNRDHLNTVRGIVSKWAPSSDGNDTGSYIAQVCAQMGVGPDTPLDLSNASTATKLIQAMSKQESGRSIDPGVANRGVRMALGQPFKPGTSPYAPISGVAEGNSLADQNTANVRVGQLQRDTGQISTDYFTNLASGSFGKVGTDVSRAVTKFDSSAIDNIGSVLNSMVSAVTGSTSGLTEFSGALSQATANLRRMNGGQSMMTGAGAGPTPMRR